MGVWNTDYIYAAVQAAVKGKVCRLGIYAVLIFIGAVDRQQVFPLRTAQICNVCTENRISALMVYRLLSIYIDRGLLSGCQDLYIDASPCQRLFWCFKAPCIPAAAALIASLSIMSIHCIPCMRQVHILPMRRKGGHNPFILHSKFPSLIQIHLLPHFISSYVAGC